jgi:hypothetical protein
MASAGRRDARIRLGEAVEDVHQRGLASAVLTEQGVDLPGVDIEGHPIIGDHVVVALYDAGQAR